MAFLVVFGLVALIFGYDFRWWLLKVNFTHRRWNKIETDEANIENCKIYKKLKNNNKNIISVRDS
jgi:hypothetical protein